MLALAALDVPASQLRRSKTWLIARQKADGGWAPSDAVERSTWVTSLAVLALADDPGLQAVVRRGCAFLAAQTVPPYTIWQRLVRRFEELPATEDAQGGSPWFPGTAAWIIPTAFMALAMKRVCLFQKGEFLAHVQTAENFLLSRRCADGGWHHGGSRFNSESAPSYPETTGLALLALRNVAREELAPSIECARNWLVRPGSIEGLSFLKLGLWVHGYKAPGDFRAFRCWTTRDLSLQILVSTVSSPANGLTHANV